MLWMYHNSDDFFTFSSLSQTRGHPYKLYKPRYTNAVRHNFFNGRVVKYMERLTSYSKFFFAVRFQGIVKNVDFSSCLKCTV